MTTRGVVGFCSVGAAQGGDESRRWRKGVERRWARTAESHLSDALRIQEDVALVLVAEDEVDFGFVYHTDLLSSTAGVAEVQGSGASKFSTSYSFAVSNNLKHSAQAQSLANAITGEVGQRILEELGFNQP